MKSLFGGLICAAMSASAGTAQNPASAPPDEQGTIVVTGTKNSEKDMRDFVRALTPVTPGGRLSRFEQSVCAAVLGLPPRQSEAVANRMRRIARTVDVPVAKPGCPANVVVMVTQDKQRFMEQLRDRYPHYFGELSQRRIRELVRQPGPAVAWHLQGAPVSARGVELAYDPVLNSYVNRTTEAATRIHSAARPQFDGAVVVVERAALEGLTATQLADYAALRAFTGAAPSRILASGPPSILRILEAPMGSEVPASLTQWDLGFLRGFYSSPRNINTSAQRSEITKAMRKEVEDPSKR